MRANVVPLPSCLKPSDLEGRVVIVFDVLRATTSMVAALSAGVKEIRIFGDTASARSARATFSGPGLLCCEENALPPKGFDLGNSPPAFTPALCAGRTAFISTTNGTRAILAARGSAAMFVGALVNASAVARAAAGLRLDITLLCAGTDGQVAMEDLLGCGAVLDALAANQPIIVESDTALAARKLFRACRHDLAGALREARGGRNVIAAGLAPDIDFAAGLDRFAIAGRVVGDPPVVVDAGGLA